MAEAKAMATTGQEDSCATQYGALCWRAHRGRVEVLLITSRDTGRWIIPKGWAVNGLSPAASAAREAWEEAGVEGPVLDADLGLFRYDKVLSPTKSRACEVRVFPLHVQRLADKFPERKERRRKWFAAEKAARKVAEPELRRLLAGLNRLERPEALLTPQGLPAANGPGIVKT